MVGSGWVVVLGDWLESAGPGGALIGFLAGGATMVTVAFCYGELAASSAQAGGEFLFVRTSLGLGPAFLVAWYLVLFAIAVCAFEAVVLGSLLQSLMPALAGPVLYRIAYTDVRLLPLLVGVAGAVMIGVLHDLGAAVAIRFQNIVTYGFLILMIALVGTGLALGSSANLTPAFVATAGHSWLRGAVWVFSICAFFLNGWQSGFHAIEERQSGVEVKHAVRAIATAIAVATMLYCGIIVSASSAAPWRRLIGQSMPARAAFDYLAPDLGLVVLIAAAVAVAKTWNAVAWIGSRLLLALARDHLAPRQLARVSPRGAPRAAIGVISAMSLLGPLCGRGALLPMVNMVSICLALSILVCLVVLMKRRRDRTADSDYVVPGGVWTILVAFVLAALMVLMALLSPFIVRPAHIPVEWYLLAAWAALGAGIYLGVHRPAARAGT